MQNTSAKNSGLSLKGRRDDETIDMSLYNNQLTAAVITMTIKKAIQLLLGYCWARVRDPSC